MSTEPALSVWTERARKLLQTLEDLSPDSPSEESPLKLIADTGVRFSDVAGLGEAKEVVYRRLVRPAINPEGARRWNQRLGGSLLIYGPPGSGKTLFAKAIAGELDLPFFTVTASSLFNRYLGQSERNVSRIFRDLEGYEAAVLFIDEAESLFERRNEDRHEVTNRVVTEFLGALDGVRQRKEGLFLLAATNYPEKIDPALLRGGRFGTPVYIPLPESAARAAILAAQLDPVPCEANLDLFSLAETLEGYSGADLVLLCQKAIDLAQDREEQTLCPTRLHRRDLEEAARTSLPSVRAEEIRRYESFRERSPGD
ncbi:MAG: ATP-binding protein [Opitutales bacterium]|nr:ATP-binding protein [Opitutales bacterium]